MSDKQKRREEERREKKVKERNKSTLHRVNYRREKKRTARAREWVCQGSTWTILTSSRVVFAAAFLSLFFLCSFVGFFLALLLLLLQQQSIREGKISLFSN